MCLSLTSAAGCTDDTTEPVAETGPTGDGDGDTETGMTDPATTNPSGDGDGDSTTGDGDGDSPTGDGDGDSPTGDGDGDSPTGDGDGDLPTGDGDGDLPTGDGDGDGDGDPTTGTETGDWGSETGWGGSEETGWGGSETGWGGSETGWGGSETGWGGSEETGWGGSETGWGGETTTGGFFIPDEDFGMPDQCDPWFQDCPVDEKCVPFASQGEVWDANKCVPIFGDGAVGDVCTHDGPNMATDDCDGDSLCWNFDDELSGTCTAFCTGTPQAPICAPGSSCAIQNDGSITLCLETCDPLAQNCGPELGCYWGGDNFQCVNTSQDIPTGGPCGFLNDCEMGNHCIDAVFVPNCDDVNCCTNYCDLDLGDADCNVPGAECVAFYAPNEAPPGEEDIGLCLVL